MNATLYQLLQNLRDHLIPMTSPALPPAQRVPLDVISACDTLINYLGRNRPD